MSLYIEEAPGGEVTEPTLALELPVTNEVTDYYLKLQNLLKIINLLTADATPDRSADYVVTYDASAGTVKRVLLRLLGLVRPLQITSAAAPSVNTDNYDFVDITALAEAITSMTTGLSGSPVNGQTLTYRIKDNGTIRAITWGASFEACGEALPITTVANKRLTVGFRYDTTTSKWGCLAAANEA